MIKKEKRVKPILVNFALALGFSFAGFLCSRLRITTIKPSGHETEVNFGRDIDATCTTSIIVEEEEETQTNGSRSENGDRVEFLLPEFDELVKEVEFEVEARKLKLGSSIPYVDFDKDDYEQEIHQLKNTVRLLQDKVQNLKARLLEYFGLREQETVVKELENRLKIGNMEVKMFNLKAQNLRSENWRLKEQVADHANVLAELDAAKAKIELLNEEIWHEAEQNKQKLVSLQQRVAKLQDQECKDAACDQEDIRIKLQKLEALESEVQELRESNSRLQIENSDLTTRFDSTQILANDANQENEHLRKENDNLMKQIEQLRSDRHSDIEELVYMQWINACLRRELQNHQPPHTKTIAKDLSKSLSPTSEKKAKQLILEYAADTNGLGSPVNFDLNQWSSSQSSSTIDSGEYDYFSSVDSSSASRTNATSQNKFLSKLRRLILGKDRNHRRSRTSFDRRYSSFGGEGSFSDFLRLEKFDLEKNAEGLKDSSVNDQHQRIGRSTSCS